MNVAIIGAAGFIGTNLAERIVKNTMDIVTVVDEKKAYFSHYPPNVLSRVKIVELKFNLEVNFDECIKGQDVVYHLVSTNNPTTSNRNIGKELADNILITINLLDACVKNNVKKIIFMSSGGTIYGKETVCPISEAAKTWPINTYGIQKLTIEKLMYLYGYMYGLEYRIIRLSNPFGPFQRPNGQLGVIATFIYNAMNQKKIQVFGDGTVVRDYIYISDAVDAILNIAGENSRYHIYNVGSGKGANINKIIEVIKNELGLTVEVEYVEVRNVDVPINYLDISRYEKEFGKIEKIPFVSGMRKTMNFLEKYNG